MRVLPQCTCCSLQLFAPSSFAVQILAIIWIPTLVFPVLITGQDITSALIIVDIMNGPCNCLAMFMSLDSHGLPLRFQRDMKCTPEQPT